MSETERPEEQGSDDRLSDEAREKIEDAKAAREAEGDGAEVDDQRDRPVEAPHDEQDAGDVKTLTEGGDSSGV